MLFIAAIIVEIMLVTIFLISLRRRASFISHYPELREFYDYGLAAMAGGIVAKAAFLPLDMSDSGLLQLTPDQTAVINATGNALIILSAAMFVLGWIRLIGALIGRYELVPVVEFTGVKPYTTIKPGVYLCTAPNCHEIVRRLLEGRAGLIISRHPPETIRLALNLEKTPVLWLSTAPGERTISPTRLEYLLHTIVEFIRKSSAQKLILLEGLEYLILENGFVPVFKFMTTLKDYAIIHNAIVIVPIDEKSLENRQIRLLKREFEVLNPRAIPEPKGDVRT